MRTAPQERFARTALHDTLTTGLRCVQVLVDDKKKNKLTLPCPDARSPHLHVVLADDPLVPERLELPDVDERGLEVPEGGVYGRYARRRPVREAHGDVHHVLRCAKRATRIRFHGLYSQGA